MSRWWRALQYRLVVFIVGGASARNREQDADGERNGVRAGDHVYAVRGDQDFTGSLTNAMRGIVLTALTQRNFRIELAAALAAIAAGMWVSLAPTDWAVLALTIGVVLGFEVKNTSVELSVDLTTREFDWTAKHAKDSSSGAVLLVATASVVVGVLIIGVPFVERLLAVLR